MMARIRVYADGTWQWADDAPYSWMSDDYGYVDVPSGDDEDAERIAQAYVSLNDLPRSQ